MSTRGTIRFKNKEGKELINIYNHCDSYIECLGKNIANFLQNIQVVNGIRCDERDKIGLIANGFGDLISQFICSIKKNVGDVYVEEYYKQDYNYIIQETTDLNDFYIEIYEFDNLIFEGNKKEFIKFTNNEPLF